MDSLQSYPVLVLGVDGGSAALTNLIGEYGPMMPVKLYYEIPAGAEWTFKAVWIVTETYCTREQMEKTIELIRAVKENPAHYGATDETIWVTIATDASAAGAVAVAVAAARNAARFAAQRKLAEDMFDKLHRELSWVPEENRYRQEISLRTGDNIAELIDIALPEPLLFATNMFTNPDATDGLTVADKLSEAWGEIAHFKEAGTEVRVQKYPGGTTIQVCKKTK